MPIGIVIFFRTLVPAEYKNQGGAVWPHLDLKHYPHDPPSWGDPFSATANWQLPIFYATANLQGGAKQPQGGGWHGNQYPKDKKTVTTLLQICRTVFYATANWQLHSSVYLRRVRVVSTIDQRQKQV